MITPEGVVSKKLIGLLKIFQTMDLKMLTEANCVTNPRVIALKQRNERVISPNNR